MKKFILILIVSLFSILFLPGCGNKTSENNNEQQIQENVVVENEIQNNDESRQDNTSKSEPQNTDYLKSYASVLSVYRNFANDYDAKRIDNERYMVAPWLGMGAMSLTAKMNYCYWLKMMIGKIVMLLSVLFIL